MKNSALALVFLLLLTSCSDELNRAPPYILTTATTGGAFYPVGVALATIAHSQLADTQGISLTAISSAGSLENVKLLRDNQAQFAILQGPFGAWSWTGEGPVSSPQTHMRSVSALWQNVESAFKFLREKNTGLSHCGRSFGHAACHLPHATQPCSLQHHSPRRCCTRRSPVCTDISRWHTPRRLRGPMRNF